MALVMLVRDQTPGGLDATVSGPPFLTDDERGFRPPWLAFRSAGGNPAMPNGVNQRRRLLTPLLFETGASHWLAISFLLVLLFGCALWSKSLPPYTLSDGETTTVERDMVSATKDSDKPGFRDLKAARSSNGDLYVCGWMDSNNKAYRSPVQAFIGTLSAGRFSPSGMGTNADANAEVVAECKKLGISI